MPSATAYPTEISLSYLPAMCRPRPLEEGWVGDSFSMSLEHIAPQSDRGRVGDKRGYPGGCLPTNCISCCPIIWFIRADVGYNFRGLSRSFLTFSLSLPQYGALHLTLVFCLLWCLRIKMSNRTPGQRI